MNICTKYGFDILIISGSYGGHRRHTTLRRTTNDGHRTTPRVWHKLPTGELKMVKSLYPGLGMLDLGYGLFYLRLKEHNINTKCYNNMNHLILT